MTAVNLQQVRLKSTNTGAVPLASNLHAGQIYVDQLNAFIYWLDSAGNMQSSPLIKVPVGSVFASQFKRALRLTSTDNFRAVKAALPDDEASNDVLTQWLGGFVQNSASDALYALTKSTLAYSAAQMDALFVSARACAP